MEYRIVQHREGKLQQDFHEILGSSYYWDLVGELEQLLSASRSPNVFRVPYELYLLQDEIISCLMDTEQAIRDGKKLKKDASVRGDTDAEQEYDLSLLRNKALVYVTQSIADGIAWRLLSFDRPSLRVMSAPKKPRGSVDFSIAYPGMREAAIKLMYENGSLVFFNDVSHYLRLGDLTEFLPDGGIVIHELKKMDVP